MVYHKPTKLRTDETATKRHVTIAVFSTEIFLCTRSFCIRAKKRSHEIYRHACGHARNKTFIEEETKAAVTIVSFSQEYVDKKDAKDDLTSQTVKLERDRSLPKNKTTLAKQYAKQLKAQVRILFHNRSLPVQFYE